MNHEYEYVNVLEEFKEISNIKKLNDFFAENNWQLLKKESSEDHKEYYQLFFGKGIQVDNMYEYGFAHLLNKEDTKKELERFIKYRIIDTKINEFNDIKKYCSSFDSYNIYDYLYFIGITNVKEDISNEDLTILIDKCSELYSEFMNPVEVAQSLAHEIYEEKSITLEQLESLSLDDYFDWYNDGRTLGNALEIAKEPYLVKIGFDCPSCKKDGSIITGNGCVNYYKSEEAYNTSNESSIVDFRFKYNINSEEVFDVECEDMDAKYRVESDCDEFIDNIKTNLLPILEKEEIELEVG